MTDSATDIFQPPALHDELFELLQTIAALAGERGYPPTLSEVGAAYGCTRQWVHEAVGKLRGHGMLESPQYARETRSLRLTHNGKLTLEQGLDAGLKG